MIFFLLLPRSPPYYWFGIFRCLDAQYWLLWWTLWFLGSTLLFFFCCPSLLDTLFAQPKTQKSMFPMQKTCSMEQCPFMDKLQPLCYLFSFGYWPLWFGPPFLPIPLLRTILKLSLFKIILLHLMLLQELLCFAMLFVLLFQLGDFHCISMAPSLWVLPSGQFWWP